MSQLEVLSFAKKHVILMGTDRWLHVDSPEDLEGTEPLLEPSSHPAAKPFKDALFAMGSRFTELAFEDVQAEYERLRGLGVRFTQDPAKMGLLIATVLDDTCRNLIQISSQPDPDGLRTP